MDALFECHAVRVHTAGGPAHAPFSSRGCSLNKTRLSTSALHSSCSLRPRHELVEIKELDFKGMFEHGKTDPDPKADPRFNVLIEELHAAMDEAFAKQTLIQQCLITNLCVGVTAWYRQMNSELRDLGVVVLDALRDELELKVRA